MQKTLLSIQAVARKLEFQKNILNHGIASGKVKLELLSDPAFKRRGKLIIVTATTPTAAGEGKTVTSISLTQGLAHIGKKVVINLARAVARPRLWNERRCRGWWPFANRAQREN